MSQEMTKEQIEQELNAQFHQAYSVGYVSGLKSVLPFIEQSKTNLDNLILSINDYLKENDPHYGKDTEDVAQAVKQLHADISSSENTQHSS